MQSSNKIYSYDKIMQLVSKEDINILRKQMTELARGLFDDYMLPSLEDGHFENEQEKLAFTALEAISRLSGRNRPIIDTASSHIPGPEFATWLENEILEIEDEIIREINELVMSLQKTAEDMAKKPSLQVICNNTNRRLTPRFAVQSRIIPFPEEELASYAVLEQQFGILSHIRFTFSFDETPYYFSPPPELFDTGSYDHTGVDTRLDDGKTAVILPFNKG